MFDNVTPCKIEVKNCDILTRGASPFFMKNGEMNLLLDNCIIIDRERFMQIPGAKELLAEWRAAGWPWKGEGVLDAEPS